MTTADLSGADLAASVAEVLREAQVLAQDYEADLSDALRLAAEQPLTEAELHSLFTKIVTRLRAGRGADSTAKREIAAEVHELVNEMVADYVAAHPTADQEHLELHDRFGMKVREVMPSPVFLGQRVTLKEGFVDVTKLRLWPENSRLTLHLNEFRKRYGRSPSSGELVDILLSKIPFEGVAPKDRLDYFKIHELADSIAANGVRVPPIIDWTGMPYDGNRRLAACIYILGNDDYDDAQRENARWIKVWQAPEDTTPEQINNIVVALNFEKDLKQPWPEYVRAKQVFDEYEKRRDLAMAIDKTPDLTKIRREVGRKFGIRTDEVTRYVKMVEWALEFQEYHVDSGRDEAEVLHRTNKYFQYFYELDSGRGDDKLSAKLDKDDALKGIVFDLLYEDKFKRWAQIRDLRKVFADEEATTVLLDAATNPDPGMGRELVEQAIAVARRHDISRKQVGVEQRVEEFTKWLETEATQQTWRNHVSLDVLKRFLAAIRAADGTVATVLEERTRDLL